MSPEFHKMMIKDVLGAHFREWIYVRSMSPEFHKLLKNKLHGAFQEISCFDFQEYGTVAGYARSALDIYMIIYDYI